MNLTTTGDLPLLLPNQRMHPLDSGHITRVGNGNDISLVIDPITSGRMHLRGSFSLVHDREHPFGAVSKHGASHREVFENRAALKGELDETDLLDARYIGGPHGD